MFRKIVFCRYNHFEMTYLSKQIISKWFIYLNKSFLTADLPYSGIDLLDMPFHGKILGDPDHKIDRAENAEIGQNAPNAVPHPAHKIRDRKNGERAYEQMRYSLAQKAPVVHFPDDGSPRAGRAVE